MVTRKMNDKDPHLVPTETEILIAFAVWFTEGWDNDSWDIDNEGHIAYMWGMFQSLWVPALTSRHCGDCTKASAPCTRCHMEEYVMFAQKVSKICSGIQNQKK